MPKPYLSGNVRVIDGQWIARFRLPSGKDSRKKIGPAWTKRGEQPPPGYYTERTARIELDKILSRYEGWTPGSDPAFLYAAQEWLEWCEKDRGQKATTLRRYKQICDHDLFPVLGRRLLSTITEQDIVALRTDLATRVSASSLNQTKIVLAGVIRYARKRRRYRGEDPSEWFDRAPILRKMDIEVYSPAEIELLARTTRAGAHRAEPDRCFARDGRRVLTEYEKRERTRMDDQDAVIFKTAGYSGLRLSEIRALRWRDVDFADAKITVRSGYTDAGGEGTPKSGKMRTVPLAPQLLAELDHLSRRDFCVGPDDLVFCTEDETVLSGSGIYHRFIAACAAAGLRRLRFHDLRHSAGTMFVQIFPINEVQEIMGHADIQTTMRYLHSVPRHDASEKLGALLSAKLGPQDNLERAIEEVPDA